MQLPQFILKPVAIGLMALAACSAYGDDYPSRPIRILASEPGGGIDYAARVVARGIAGPLGVSVIVENRGGAGGLLAIKAAVDAQPDGYTLVLFGSTIWLFPFLRDNVGYDPVKDLAPISLAMSSPNIVVIHPSLPVHSIKDLIALAKAKPGQLNYGSSSIGASTHLAVELFKSMAGLDIVRVPYKGTAPALIGLTSNQVQVMFSTMTGAIPLIKAGKITALAVASAQPSALFPELPTVAASLPGYESASITALFAPAKTPAARIIRINQEVARYLRTPEAKEMLLKSNIEPIASSPQELTRTMKNEMARLGKVIKEQGIRDE